jgi:hypothetical protein
VTGSAAGLMANILLAPVNGDPIQLSMTRLRLDNVSSREELDAAWHELVTRYARNGLQIPPDLRSACPNNKAVTAHFVHQWAAQHGGKNTAPPVADFVRDIIETNLLPEVICQAREHCSLMSHQ